VASFINPHDICFAYRARHGVNHNGVLSLYEEAVKLPDHELPPLPENFAIPDNEPIAVKTYLDPDAITPAIRMRDEYNEHDWRINRWIYHRLTEKVDQQIGELLEGMGEAGLLDQTVIFFVSDHGNLDGSHQLTSKSLFYEESVRVPLIIREPGGQARGVVDREHLVSTGLDLLPTLCDYAGVAQPEHMLGASLRPLADGRGAEAWRDYVVAENEWFRMLRSDRYKYCAFADDSAEWLGDLQEDPGELRNFVMDPAFADTLAKHRDNLIVWCKLSGDQDVGKYELKRSVNLCVKAVRSIC
jgi:choline-sulfatase